jgi:hypothetical protein
MNKSFFFTALLFFLVSPINLSASDTLNSFDPNLPTFDCVAEYEDENTWDCIERKNKSKIKFNEIDRNNPSNVLTKVNYENEYGLLFLSLFINRGVISLEARDDYEVVKINMSQEGDMYGKNMMQRVLETDLTYIGEWDTTDEGIYIKSGQGELTSPNGDKFVGIFDDEYAKGTITYADGSIYNGSIDADEGLINGNGKYVGLDGSTYEGEFKSGKPHGQIFYTGKEFTFTGTAANDMWHGNGQIKWKNGAKYIGAFRDGAFHGYGKYIYEEDNLYYSKYEGEYRDGKVTGIGNYYDKEDRLIYSGELKNAIKDGYGVDIFYFEDGSIWRYVGDFKDNKYHGKGKLIFSNGDFYEGDFISDKRTGRGVLSELDRVTSGYFVDGVLQGRANVTYRTLDLEVQIEFKDGLEEGDGVATTISTGVKFPVSFKEGVYQGSSDIFPEDFITNKRIALVIGNNDYKIGKLNFAVNDSFAIKNALEDTGFEVIHITNSSQQSFLSGLEDFRKLIYQYGSSTTALFYYSGHAAQIDGTNYLYPIDAKIESKGDIEVETINMGRVFSILDSTLTGVKIVILDACRDNPYSVFTKTTSKGLATSKSSSGTIIGYSTGPGETAIDGGKGELSFYTASLIQEMSKTGLDIEDVFKYTSRSVAKETYNRQTPWYSSSLLVDFYFTEKK